MVNLSSKSAKFVSVSESHLLKTAITAIVLFNGIKPANCQEFSTEGFNQIDEKGRKTGFWVEFTDSNLRRVSDTSKAQFCELVNYVMGSPEFYGLKKQTLQKSPESVDASIAHQGFPLLNGQYKLSSDQGKHWQLMSYDDGVLVDIKSYLKRGDILNETVQFKAEGHRYLSKRVCSEQSDRKCYDFKYDDGRWKLIK